MLLPGCDRCGQCGCVCGKLPYTLTVEFDGLVNRTHSTYCPLTITSNFGCGAAAVATSPGGCDDSEPDCGETDRGPLAGVLLLDGGHDYARLGRREPVLTVSGGSGSGATYTATLEPVDDTLAESCRNYRLASVAVTGGSNYVDGEALTITADGVTVTPAVAIIHVGRSQPTVTASVAGGSGASLAVSLNSTGSGNSQEWHVASVAVNNGGTGYTFSGDPPIYTATLPVTFATTDTTVTAATGTARPVVTEPPLNAAWTNGAGTGFAATLTLTATTDGGLPCYTVSGIAITAAGSGYAVGDTIEFTAENYGSSDSGVVDYTVTTVDGSGGVTGVSAANVLEFFARPTGAIASVTVVEDGAYYATGTTPSGVEVTEQGEYYTEDPTEPVCLAEVTVSADACGGSGAEITATIGDDPEDAETWGRITALTIDDGGDDYLAWRWICTNQSDMNAVPFVLTAVDPQKLVTLNVSSDFGSGACLRVVPVGDGTTCDPPTPVLYDGQPGPIREVEVVSQGSGYARMVDGDLEVATVTVNVVQLPPSAGSGAVISVTIGTTPGPDFGKILSATVTSGGSGYTLLGGPTQCVYSASPCGNEFQPLIEYRLRGNGNQPEVVLTDNRTDPGNTTVLRCADTLDDCDNLPASASLLYGAPAGVTATITPGGTVTTECEQPAWCAGKCACPADYILPETQVVVTSDVPCAEGGTAGYSGDYQDLDLSCGYRNEPAGTIVYTNDIGISIECCPSPNCNEDGPCLLQVRVCANGYVYDDVTDTWCPASGCSECLDWDVVDGEAVGTATFDIVHECPGNRNTTYSMTVTVGGA